MTSQIIIPISGGHPVTTSGGFDLLHTNESLTSVCSMGTVCLHDDMNVAAQFPLLSALNTELSVSKVSPYYKFSYDSSSTGVLYGSRKKSEAALNSILGKAYGYSESFFHPDSENCPVKALSEYYGRPFARIGVLITSISAAGSNNYSMIVKNSGLPELAANAASSFLKDFSAELCQNSAYYAFFRKSYYYDLAYNISNLTAALAELEHDLNIRASTFFSAACRIYKDYLHGLLSAAAKISDCLPDIRDDEDVIMYLTRLSSAGFRHNTSSR